jgi:lysophospholipase L1-like esterase
MSLRISNSQAVRLLLWAPRTARNYGKSFVRGRRLDAAINQHSEAAALSGYRPWAGKRISIYGTSVTAGAGADVGHSFVDLLSAWLGAEIDNQGVGASGIVWDGTRERSLSATREELRNKGFDPSQSFETKLLGKRSDLVIFDHHYNDRDRSIGEPLSQDKSTFFGAYNFIISALILDNPTVRFCFTTPHSLYAPDGRYNFETAKVREAMMAVASRYCVPILDVSRLSGFDELRTPLFLPDLIHPGNPGHAVLARLYGGFVNGL